MSFAHTSPHRQVVESSLRIHGLDHRIWDVAGRGVLERGLRDAVAEILDVPSSAITIAECRLEGEGSRAVTELKYRVELPEQVGLR